MKCRPFLPWIPAILLILCGNFSFSQSTAQPAPDIHHADRFEEKAQIVQNGGIDVVFLGDSITHFWDVAGENVQKSYFGDFRLVNLGLGWNCTEHVLWELENIPADRISPKAVMMMIGTNNIGNKHNTPDEVIAGNAAILAKVRTLWPDARILLLGIFPRGEQPTDSFRAVIAQTNEGLAKLVDGQHIFYLNIGEKFLDDDGYMHAEISPDRLHLTADGYEIWAKAVEPILRSWVAE